MKKLPEKIQEIIDANKDIYGIDFTTGMHKMANHLLEVIEKQRAALVAIEDACIGEIGCWCGKMVRGVDVEECPKCMVEQAIIDTAEVIGEK